MIDYICQSPHHIATRGRGERKKKGEGEVWEKREGGDKEGEWQWTRPNSGGNRCPCNQPTQYLPGEVITTVHYSAQAALICMCAKELILSSCWPFDIAVRLSRRFILATFYRIPYCRRSLAAHNRDASIYRNIAIYRRYRYYRYQYRYRIVSSF